MRGVAFLGLSGVLVGAWGCGQIDVGDSPFDVPVSGGTTTGPPPGGSSSDGVDPSITSGEPTGTSDPGTTDDPPDPDSSGDAPPMCGNGVREGDELCDGEDFGDTSCESELHRGHADL